MPEPGAGAIETGGSNQPDVTFEATNNDHRIIFSDETKAGAVPALVMAAFKKSRVAQGGFMTGHANYRSDIDPKRAMELIEETADEKTGQLFFLDYVHDREVKVGARQNSDGSFVLFDRTGKPIPQDKARNISEWADGYVWDVIDFQEESK